jgi:hypothetical protein
MRFIVFVPLQTTSVSPKYLYLGTPESLNPALIIFLVLQYISIYFKIKRCSTTRYNVGAGRSWQSDVVLPQTSAVFNIVLLYLLKHRLRYLNNYHFLFLVLQWVYNCHKEREQKIKHNNSPTGIWICKCGLGNVRFYAPLRVFKEEKIHFLGTERHYPDGHFDR